MAEAALSFAVEKLGDLLIQKAVFLRGVEGQVKWLKDELQRMQCFLKDAAEKQSNDERIRKWISDTRDIAHDAEDAIETFVLKVDTPRRSRGLLGRCSSFPIHVYHLNRVGEEIESIRARLQDIERSRQTYGIQDLEGMNSSRGSEECVEWRRQLSPWQTDKDVVGLEEDVASLLQRAILEETKGLSAATIVGMGGIGKSTLARKVYNHSDVTNRFQLRSWVVVSREFDPEKIIKELVLQLLDSKEDKLKELKIMEKSPLSHLQQMLYERLKGKQYFVVLDDVWQEDAWESIAGAFPDEDKASRVMLTSRNQVVTKYTRYVHSMKFLDSDQSWELFLKKAFVDNTESKCPRDLESIGREILKKCDGLPLAITVAGGLLVKQRQSKNEWEKVLRRMNSHLGGSGSSVSAILELSYHDLPPQLKSCFLCFGFFKEDAAIKAEKLIQIWIAQSLVVPEKEETMEEIARSYLDELINRNMVQIKYTSKDYRVKYCQVHDLLRELSIQKAKEEINFEILKEEGNSNSQSLEKPRHRAIYCSNTERLINSKSQNKHLRSLFIRGAGKVDDSLSYWKSFGLLRTLDFEDFYLMNNFPVAIGELVSLRYLGLRHTKITELPNSVGRLKNLEVLDIARNKGIKVPNILWKLANLRHMYMSEITSEQPLKLDTLKNLQTLMYIPADNWSPEQPLQMTNLLKMGIKLKENSDVSKILTSLAKLERLIRLKIRGPYAPNMPALDGLGTLQSLTQLKVEGGLGKLPSNFPPNISHLTLVDSLLIEDPMPVLEKLQNLVYLKLDNAYDDQEMVIHPGGFSSLKVLSLRKLSELVNIEIGEGAMAELKALEIYKIPGLERLPEQVEFMSNLEELKMVTTSEVANRLRGEDWHIISNIQFVNLIEVSDEDALGVSANQMAGIFEWFATHEVPQLS